MDAIFMWKKGELADKIRIQILHGHVRINMHKWWWG